MPARKKPAGHKVRQQRLKRHIQYAKRNLNPRQGKFLEAFIKARSQTKAAIEAGYNGPPGQAGHEVLKRLQRKAPEVFAELGLSLDNIIENRLIPLMFATETKLAQHEGEFTDAQEVEALGIQLQATQTALELMNAYPPRDPVLAAQVGVKVVVMDAFDGEADMSIVDVVPKRRTAVIAEVGVQTPAKANGSASNGHKPKRGANGDPRPKD